MYLSREDLVSLGPSDPDDIFEKTEGFVEDVLFRLASITGKVSPELFQETNHILLLMLRY